MKMVISAGGTGGHIIPALAIAREFRRRQGWEINWLGSKGMERSLLLKEGLRFFALDIVALRGKGWLRWFYYPPILIWALFQALVVLVRLRPSALLVTGGYVGFPAALAARLLGKPLFIQEQNIYWGLATRLLSKLAKRIYLGFPHDTPHRQAVCYGNPTPIEDILSTTGYSSPQERYANRRGPLRLLIIGGSRGAQIFNQIVPQALISLETKNLSVRHQSGKGWLEDTRNHYAKLDCPVEVTEFITDMKEAYLWADLVIARAGALTLTEISLVGVASWLVPFPFATDDHQFKNASFFFSKRAAELIRQEDFTAVDLSRKISSMMKGAKEPTRARNLLAQMAVRAHRLATPYASRKIVDDIIKELKCA